MGFGAVHCHLRPHPSRIYLKFQVELPTLRLHLREHLAIMLGSEVGLLAPLTSALGVTLCSFMLMLLLHTYHD